MAKSSKLSKVVNGKHLTRLVKVLDVLPDTTRIIGDAIHSVTPLLDKAMEQNYQKQSRLIRLPNVVDMQVVEAKKHLEELGLSVSLIVAKPHPRYAQKDAGEVVATSPRSGNLEPGSLVKLYYVTKEVLAESKAPQALPDVCGLSLSDAKAHLEELGLKPIPLLLEAHAKYAGKRPNIVLAMSPRPIPLMPKMAEGSLVKLYYLNEQTVEKSQDLAQKQGNLLQELEKATKKIPKLFPKK